MDARAAVDDRVDQPADGGGKHRNAAGGRLERHDPERLVPRDARDDVGGAEQLGHAAPSHGAEQANAVLHAVLTRERKQAPSLRVAGELVTNAYKHAFPADRGGTLTVRLGRTGSEATLQVQDNGVGIDLDRLAHSAGLRIAEALAGQVDGTLHFANRPQGGAEVRLTFRAK